MATTVFSFDTSRSINSLQISIKYKRGLSCNCYVYNDCISFFSLFLYLSIDVVPQLAKNGNLWPIIVLLLLRSLDNDDDEEDDYFIIY